LSINEFTDDRDLAGFFNQEPEPHQFFSIDKVTKEENGAENGALL